MGTVARHHFNQITNDETMDEFQIKDLIIMLERHLEELSYDT